MPDTTDPHAEIREDLKRWRSERDDTEAVDALRSMEWNVINWLSDLLADHDALAARVAELEQSLCDATDQFTQRGDAIRQRDEMKARVEELEAENARIRKKSAVRKRHLRDLNKSIEIYSNRWGNYAKGWAKLESDRDALKARVAELEGKLRDCEWRHVDAKQDIEFYEAGALRSLFWDEGDSTVGIPAGYVVKDGLLDDLRENVTALESENADLRRRLENAVLEQEGLHGLTDRQADLLTRSVNAIRGEPDELTLWSHHDLPELVSALVAERDDLRRENRRQSEWLMKMDGGDCPIDDPQVLGEMACRALRGEEAPE